ncbi:DNA repair protein rhp54 [Hordeum vulgare]|nr:DNA repair protein rhp54 [Hordeum vulgare]
MALLDSPRASACNPMFGFYVYPQASRLSRECPREVNVVAPSTPAPIDLNATSMAGGSSSLGARKRALQMPANVMLGARNLFDEMPSVGDEDYMQNLIFEGGAPAAGYDPDETQSRDDRGAFTPSTFDQDQAAFIRDQVGMDLDGFPLDHEFPEDYGQEHFKLWRHSRSNTMASASTSPIALGSSKTRRSSRRNMPPSSRVGKQAVEEVGDDENARPQGKTSSKKEDKRDAASNALIASVEGMMSKKGSREEERWRYKQEQMNAFMEIQGRRLEMKAEKQAKMLEMEAKKQVKMLEIEAANAKTKAKEVAFASTMTGLKIMMVDLNTVSSRKRSWFEKMQANMLKFDEEWSMNVGLFFMPAGLLA